MSDLISRQAVLDMLENINAETEGVGFYYEHYVEYIKKLPSVENKGEWKRISPAGIYECSCCGQYVMTSDIECYKFCHGCGADMGGKAE